MSKAHNLDECLTRVEALFDFDPTIDASEQLVDRRAHFHNLKQDFCFLLQVSAIAEHLQHEALCTTALQFVVGLSKVKDAKTLYGLSECIHFLFFWAGCEETLKCIDGELVDVTVANLLEQIWAQVVPDDRSLQHE